MPKKKYSLVSATQDRAVKPIDVTRSLLPPFLFGVSLSGGLSLFLTAQFNLWGTAGNAFGEGILVCIFIAFWGLLFIPSLGVVNYMKYGTVQLYHCAILLKVIESDLQYKVLISRLIFNWLVWLYRILGKYTSSEEVEGFCYTIERYQDYIGQGKRGAVAQRVKLLENNNFFREEPTYATVRRLFIELTEKGSKLFRTKEHVYFEQGE